jgi:multiple sugar transport system permease protein
MKSKLSLSSRIKKNYFIPLTLAPAMVVLTAYTFYPTIYSFVLSFFKTRIFSPERFYGLRQYISIFTDSLFWTGVKNTVLYSIGAIAGTIIVGLFLAIVLNSPIRGRAFFRTAFFIPYVIPLAAHALLWMWLFDPKYGLVNYLLGFAGVDTIPWLTSRNWVIWAFILIDIWKRAGFAMVLFIAGLQTISNDYYDAAIVDGANVWGRFRHITLPLLSPITLFVFIMSFLHTFQLFTEPYVMTKGGPGNSSVSVVYLIYQDAFRSMNIGRSSAMAVFLFVVICLLTVLLIRKFDIKEI